MCIHFTCTLPGTCTTVVPVASSHHLVDNSIADIKPISTDLHPCCIGIKPSPRLLLDWRVPAATCTYIPFIMEDKAVVVDDKEVKRRKQVKKMTKILSRAWDLPNSDPFQECTKNSTAEDVFDLASLGGNLDSGVYKCSRSGWEKFARDIGGVYNRHIER